MRLALCIAALILAGCATRQEPFLLRVQAANVQFPQCAAVIAFATPEWQFWQSPQKFVACQDGRGGFIFMADGQPAQTSLSSAIGEAAKLSPISPTIPITPAP